MRLLPDRPLASIAALLVIGATLAVTRAPLPASAQPAAAERAPAAPSRVAGSAWAWGASLLANGVILSMAIPELSGEEEGRDRAAWITAAAGTGAVLSGVEFLRGLRHRPSPRVDATPWALDVGARDGLRREAGHTSQSASGDPVAGAIEAGGPTRLGLASGTTPSSEIPTVAQSVRRRQAWLPGSLPAAAIPSKSDAPVGEPVVELSVVPAAPDSGASSVSSAAPESRAPEPAPSSTSLSVPLPEIRHTVLVGSHQTMDEADHDAAWWREQGYAARVDERSAGEGRRWYRVTIGEFSSQADADLFLIDLLAEHPDRSGYVVPAAGFARAGSATGSSAGSARR